MSISLPVTAIAFGSVAPPQGDIVDLTVHLGCSSEISSFECTLQNWDKKYSPDGGTYPIVEGSVATISLGRGSNCPLLLTGKVEETDPESRAIEHYLIVRGRCNGEQLFRRNVTKAWDNVKGEVVVKYLIDNYSSLSHIRSSVELIEDTDTTYTRLDFEDTPVFDIIKYIAETADKAGAIGFDSRIAPDGKFEFFPKNSKVSSVDLSERLEIGRHKRSIYRIKNKIVVKGATERPEPIDRDQWTEPTQDPPENWVAVSADTTITRSAVNPKSGIYRVLAVKGTLGTLDFYRSISALNVEKGTSLKFWGIYGVIITGFSVRLRAPDASNYFERIMAVEQENIWRFYELPTGRGTEYDAVTNPNGTWIKVGSPSWSDVQGIEFLVTRPVGGFNLAVDGMFFDKFRWRAMREDAPSQTQYGVRERPPEVDEELHSDAECDYRAKALLDFLKGPIITPKARSTVIDYGLTPILAADKTHITLPNENVDADYRLISVEYKLVDPTILEVELELAKEPQMLADFIYGFRKSIAKLDKYKASASAGVVASGGGGGSGMVQHANEWHDPDMALQSDFASHKDRHKSGGADAFVLADLLDAVARVKVRKNTGSDVGSRRRLNLIEGSNVTLTVADDPTDEEVDVTFNVTTQLSFLKTARYYRSILSTNSITSGTPPLIDNLWATCYPITRKMTFSEIAIQLSVGVANGKVRLGIYDDSDGAPNNLIIDCGEIDASTSGLKIIVFSPALQLDAGVYWLVFVANSSTIAVYRQTGYMHQLLGHNGGLIDTYGGYYRAYAYGVLPNPFGSVSNSANIWAIGLKLQSVP